MQYRSAFRTGWLTVSLLAGVLFTAGNAAGQQTGMSVDVDREFDLDIAHDRIVEDVFVRSTAASLETRNLKVNAGAAVSAERITLTLNGVKGRVIFRASLGPIRSRLERLRTRTSRSNFEPANKSGTIN